MISRHGIWWCTTMYVLTMYTSISTAIRRCMFFQCILEYLQRYTTHRPLGHERVRERTASATKLVDEWCIASTSRLGYLCLDILWGIMVVLIFISVCVIGSPKLQIIFHKRATIHRSLLRKMTYKDKGSYESLPPCSTHIHFRLCVCLSFPQPESYISTKEPYKSPKNALISLFSDQVCLYL